MKQEPVEIVRFQEASLDLDLKNQHVLFEKPDLLLALFVLENRNIVLITIEPLLEIGTDPGGYIFI
jgi:hypothetical protein